MGSTSDNADFGAVTARTRDGNLAAVSATQQATSGGGNALRVHSENPSAAAVSVRGAGTLMELRDSGGTVRFAVDQSGNMTTTGNAMGESGPASHNLTSWTYDPSGAVNAIQLTGGTVYLAKLWVPADVSVTKLYWWMAVAGSGATAGQNFGGLYSSAGVRLATADADAKVAASAGLQTLTIPTTALTAGTFVWAALVFNATAVPTVTYAAGAAGATTALNVGLTAATYRYATAGTSQTALPSSITPASNSASLIAGPWMAVGP